MGEVLGSLEPAKPPDMVPVPKGFRNLLPTWDDMKRCRFAFECSALALHVARCPTTLVRTLPVEGFRDTAPDPQRQQRGQNADVVRATPIVAAQAPAELVSGLRARTAIDDPDPDEA